MLAAKPVHDLLLLTGAVFGEDTLLEVFTLHLLARTPAQAAFLNSFESTIRV